MDFVWIYAKKFSAYYKSGLFNELDYSIRSVRKNFQGDARCFVVGDDPGLDAIHLKAPPLVTHDPINKEPVNLDLLNKMEAIIDSHKVNEEFILMYDDIFILKPTTKEELKQEYGRCEVVNPSNYIQTRNGGRPYKKLWVSTYDYIVPFRLQKGLKSYDWETHLPRFLEKKKLKWLINALNLRDIPKIPTSLYSAGCYIAADEFKDCEIPETLVMPPDLQSDIWTHTPGMDLEAEFNKKYMNIYDDVLVPEFLERMYDAFGK